MIVNFLKLRENARLPEKKHQDDLCYDVYACDCEEIAPNVYKYNLGFALQIDRRQGIKIPDITFSSHSGWQVFHNTNLSIDFRPRSSVWETGMVLANCEGTVDYGYTGEISAIFYHVMPNMPKYEPGDKILQMKIGFSFPIEFREVDKLLPTSRGAGGFGSTGKN